MTNVCQECVECGSSVCREGTKGCRVYVTCIECVMCVSSVCQACVECVKCVSSG